MLAMRLTLWCCPWVTRQWVASGTVGCSVAQAMADMTASQEYQAPFAEMDCTSQTCDALLVVQASKPRWWSGNARTRRQEWPRASGLAGRNCPVVTSTNLKSPAQMHHAMSAKPSMYLHRLLAGKKNCNALVILRNPFSCGDKKQYCWTPPCLSCPIMFQESNMAP